MAMDTVTIQLSQEGPKTEVVHMIDLATKYTMAATCPGGTKSARATIRALEKWRSVFGSLPRRVLMDNGTEYINVDVVNMLVPNGSEPMRATTHSPFQNGVVERHNGVLKSIVERVRKGVQNEVTAGRLDGDQILDASVAAKNSLVRRCGFSSQYLMTGTANPLLTPADERTLAEDAPPAGADAKAMHELRMATIKSVHEVNLSNDLKKALTRRLTGQQKELATGEVVDYWDEQHKRWVGPCRVLAYDGNTAQIVWLKTPERLEDGITQAARVPAHRIRLRSTEAYDAVPLSLSKEAGGRNMVDAEVQCGPQAVERRLDPSADPSPADGTAVGAGRLDVPDPQPKAAGPKRRGRPPAPQKAPGEVEHVRNAGQKRGRKPGKKEVAAYLDRVEVVMPSPRDDDGEEEEGHQEAVYLASDTEEVFSLWLRECPGKLDAVAGHDLADDEAIVTCLATEETAAIDLENLNPKRELPVHVVRGPDFEAPKQKEIKGWLDYDCVEEVEKQDVKGKILQVRWVGTQKSDGTKKARLVVRGYQDLEETEDYSPTGSSEGRRLTATIAATNRWELLSADVAQAFLQGKLTERDVYCKPPPEARLKSPTAVWRFKKEVYGFRGAPRAWYAALRKKLEEIGMKCCATDRALFTWVVNGECRGMVCAHVDDLLFCGDAAFLEQMEVVRTCFKFKSYDSAMAAEGFEYCGLRVMQNADHETTFDQVEYLERMNPIPLEKERNGEESLEEEVTEEERTQFRGLIGKMRWLADHTRPDVSVEAGMLAGKVHDLRVKDLVWANKVLRTIKHRSVRMEPVLRFQSLGDLTELKVCAWGDAAFQNLPKGGTQGGFLIALVGPNETNAPLLWSSRRIPRVVKSTIAAEVIMAGITLDAGCSIRDLVYEVLTTKRPMRAGQMDGRFDSIPLYQFCDAKNVVEHAKSVSRLPEERRLLADFLVLSDAVQSGEIKKLMHVRDEHMVADGLTKIKTTSQDNMLSYVNGDLAYDTTVGSRLCLMASPYGQNAR